MAPIPAGRLVEIIKTAIDDLEVSNAENTILPPSGDLEPEVSDSDDDDVRDDYAHFEKEVHAQNDA